ncbi:hypothetical protein CGK27_16595, partial [Vibrio parahaemolyticus]
MSFEKFSTDTLINSQKQCYIYPIEFIKDLRGSVMIS